MNIAPTKVIDEFKLIANQQAGLQANLHFYQGNFRKLGLKFHKDNKTIVIGFVGLQSVKLETNWIFKGFEVESLSNDLYKIYDRNYFEVTCTHFGVFEEIIEQRDNNGVVICKR